MRLDPLSKIQIARHLFQGKLSRRAIARQFGVSDDSVRRIARELGLWDADATQEPKRAAQRCKGCGRPRGARESCPVCEHRFREELARRRRQYERELRENPQRILKLWDEHQRRRAGHNAET
jgi:transposase-like protein